MAKDLEFFNDFFADPAALKAREFYMYVHEWLEYLKEHEGEFNYLEDEEWRDRKDRVLVVLTRQEDLKDEFEEIEERLDAIQELETDDEKIEVYKEWLAFMKRNRSNYDFSDEDIADIERQVGELIISVLDCTIAHERLKRSRTTYEKWLEKLDNSLTEHYLRTGKRPVLTALPIRKRLKGN